MSGDLSGADRSVRKPVRIGVATNYNMEILRDQRRSLGRSLGADVSVEFFYNTSPELAVRAMLASTDPEFDIVLAHFEELANAVGGVGEEYVFPAKSVQDALTMVGDWRGVPGVIGTVAPLPTTRWMETHELARAAEARESFNNWVRAQARAQPDRWSVLDWTVEFGRHGERELFDHRFWTSIDSWMTPLAAQVTADAIVTALERRLPAKKVLFVDGDNTLWPGVLGEDGIAATSLGVTKSRSVPFMFAQRQLRELANRGVLVIVCSKNLRNDVETALNQPGSLLRTSDLVAILAGWRPKSELIREELLELSLAPGDAVFIDDNPAELAEVSRSIGDLTCWLVPSDPLDYPDALRTMIARNFAGRALTGADATRVESYRARTKAAGLLATATDYTTYLAELEMEVLIEHAHPEDAGRISQISERTNQFNVRKSPMSVPQVAHLTSDSDSVVLTVSARDRFGDHGVVGIVVLQYSHQIVTVTTFALSCRVLKRNIEWAMLAVAADATQDHFGAMEMEIPFTVTARNQPAVEFLSDVAAIAGIGSSILSTDGLLRVRASDLSKSGRFPGVVRANIGAANGDH